MSIRVHELARELGVESKTVMERATALGVSYRSPSSRLSNADATRVRESLGDFGTRIQTRINATDNGWRAGSIKPPLDEGIQRGIATMCRAFPVMAAHRRSLRLLGSEVVYAGYAKDPKFTECAVTLVRFSGAIESAFGLTREVLFFYSPHGDTQIRAYHAARDAILSVPREVTPDLVFVWSSDKRLKSKLDDWSSDGFMAIPLSVDHEDPIAFITLLRDYIFSRDLFYETTPVQGDRFFGRRTLLQGIRDDVRQGRVAGVYGLRKAGKTSVLTQLRSDLDSQENLVVLQDLESLPSFPDDPVPQLLGDVSSAVLGLLRDRGYPSKSLANIAKLDITSFKSGIGRTLRELHRRGARLTLLLDEIEYLTPADRVDIREGPMPSIAQFLGLLRSLVQENQNFTFLLSGLTSAITESGRLYGRPNPLFTWAKAYYLGPLTQLEADTMATSVGSRMGVRIDKDALNALYEATGGHAFLYRHLASHAIGTLPMDVFERRLSRSDILRSLESWRGLIAGIAKEMIDHVSRYYPTEAELMDVLPDDPDFFLLLAKDEPLAISHLKALGLVTGDLQSGFESSPLLDMV